MKTNITEKLEKDLATLKLSFIAENYRCLEKAATNQAWLPREYLAKLVCGEVQWQLERVVKRRISQARFPVVKTLQQFCWQWPKKINKGQIKQLFALDFIEQKSNVIFIGPVGVGKSHLATALGYQACQAGYRVLFINAIELINNLILATKQRSLKEQLRKYTAPQVLILDELGYLPIDKHGADLLFQVIGSRYEKASTILTSNKAYNDWVDIFKNDAGFTSALLDRLLHHCDTVLIEGSSYRMKDKRKAVPKKQET